MGVTLILRKLRQERLAIDQAISALEKIRPKHKMTKHEAIKTSGKDAPVSSNASEDVLKPQIDKVRGDRIIAFPGGKRVG